MYINIAGNTLQELIENAKNIPMEAMSNFMSREKTWAIHVGAYGRSYGSLDQKKCRLKFQFLKFLGQVQLESPDVLLMILFDYSSDIHPDSAALIEEYPDVPCYLARVLSRGGMREVILSGAVLKNRKTDNQKLGVKEI